MSAPTAEHYREEETVGRMPDHVAAELKRRGKPIQTCTIHRRTYLRFCIECHPEEERVDHAHE